MRVSSTPRRWAASETLAASVLIRSSMLLSAVWLQGSRNCQPRCWHQACQVWVSPPSRTSMGDFAGCAAIGHGVNSSASANRAVERALSAPQPGVYTFGQFLNFFRLLEAGEREHVPIVLFQLLLQPLGQLDQLSGILQVPLVVRLQDLLLLGFSVRQTRRIVVLRRQGLRRSLQSGER